MVSEKMYELGTKKSTIRTIFEFGRKRAAEVGEELSVVHRAVYVGEILVERRINAKARQIGEVVRKARIARTRRHRHGAEPELESGREHL